MKNIKKRNYKNNVDFILREKKLASDKSNTLDTW